MAHKIFKILTPDVRNRCAAKVGDFCQHNDELTDQLMTKIGDATLEYISGGPETNFVFEQIIDKITSMSLTAEEILDGQDNGNFQITVNDAVNNCHLAAMHNQGILR